MALKLVATLPHHQQQQQQQHYHQSYYNDLPSFLDSYILDNNCDNNPTTQLSANQHQFQQQRSSKIFVTNFTNNNNNSNLMEFNNSNNNNNNSHNNTNSLQTTGNLQHNQQISTNISQLTNTTNRNLMSGFHHQHFGAEYEPVITFVDSPPNSEESWPDDQSKGSPGPQIIDVQTIYSNSGSRKRRMDWDPLEIGQSESTASAQTGELPAKISTQQLLEKDKYKKERLNTGRGTWGDDIGFDLNAEFNSNSYLNNESFMTFASGLPTALKQEPQSEQLKINKTSLNINHQDPSNINISTKSDKPPLTPPTIATASAAQTAAAHLEQSSSEKLNKNNIIENHCSGILEQNSNANKVNNLNSEQQQARNNSMPPHHQLLTVVDASKIEQIPGGRDTTSNTSNSDDYKFQYILAAATSIATKNNEDTLTYLNQGQSYEIKLKKIGDLSLYRDKILKSVIKICFHERRLQYMEREQMQQWQASRPGERIIEVDLPLSYGLCHVSQPLNPNYLNTVEILWDPMKEVGVYIKVNCISTEFTPKKHGGEKGVPFRLQIETYVESSNNNNNSATAGNKSPLGLQAASQSPTQAGNLTPNSSILSLAAAKQAIHAAACQIKVFKLKGADRKHKQDREKIQKRPQSEQDKFQPSYECTIMTDIPLDLISPSGNNNSNGCFSPEYMKIWPNSPVHMPKYDGIMPFNGNSPNANNASPIAINSVSSTNSTNLKIMDPNNLVNTPAMVTDIDEYNSITIMPESTPAQVTQWLTYHRLTTYLSTFAHFSGADIMRMSKEDLIQICGLADGIRMFNILRAKAITPRLTIYISLDGSNYNAVYLISNTAKELLQKLFKLPGFYECVAKSSTQSHNGNAAATANTNMMDNSSPYHSWGAANNMHSKYSGSGSNIYNEVNSKSLVYVTGPAGIHVAVTDEVLNNEIRDGSLYGLEVQNGKVIMKLINKNEI